MAFFKAFFSMLAARTLPALQYNGPPGEFPDIANLGRQKPLVRCAQIAGVVDKQSHGGRPGVFLKSIVYLEPLAAQCRGGVSFQ